MGIIKNLQPLWKENFEEQNIHLFVPQIFFSSFRTLILATPPQNGAVSRSGPILAMPPQNGAVSRSGSVPRIHVNALGTLRKELLIAEKASHSGRKERAKSDQPSLYHQHPDAASMFVCLYVRVCGMSMVRASCVFYPPQSPVKTPPPPPPPPSLLACRSPRASAPSTKCPATGPPSRPRAVAGSPQSRRPHR